MQTKMHISASTSKSHILCESKIAVDQSAIATQIQALKLILTKIEAWLNREYQIKVNSHFS